MFADIFRKNHSILTDGMVINQIIAQNLNETSIYIKVRIIYIYSELPIISLPGAAPRPTAI